MTHALRCACGAVTGSVGAERAATHSRCYCKDCQAFARFLGREGDMLDAQGGVEGIQTLPQRITFHSGAEKLACVRLSESGLLRWYAACCNTPIGNTPSTSRLPFVGLARSCLEHGERSVDAAFGPVRFSLYVSGARGTPMPRPFGAWRLIAWMLRNTTWARLRRDFGPNPFFDVDADRPIAAPAVLSPAERHRLREGLPPASP